MIEYICSFEEEYGFLVSASMKYGEELIRCKDCKMYHREDDLLKLGLCAKTEALVSRDDFCSQAERKE